MRKTTNSIAILSVIVAIAAISTVGFQVNEIIAADDTEDKGYNFAEGKSITGVMSFNDQTTEITEFQVFNQKSGFDRSETYNVELIKTSGDTPYLNQAADDAYHYRTSPAQLKYTYFDVDLIIAEGGDIKRSFSYGDCVVVDYKIATFFDKEEGWTTSKGFAVTDEYELECKSYTPHNPQLEEIMDDRVKAQTKSTMDLKEPFPSWDEHFKYADEKS